MTPTEETHHRPRAAPTDAALAHASLRAREEVRTKALVAMFVQTRAAKGAVEALEISTLADAAALVEEQQARVDRASSRHAEIPERIMVAELATASSMSERTIRRQMADAADLCARFPQTVTALREGRISRTHVGVIHEGGFAIDEPGARAEYEEAAITRAEAMTAARLRPTVRLLAARANPRTIDERHATAREARAVRVIDLPDGMADLIATLPAVLAHGIHDRLTRQARAVIDARILVPASAGAHADANTDAGADEVGTGQTHVDGDATPGPDSRSMNVLRADVLADLLLTGTPLSSIAGDGLAAIRATVQITLPVLTAATGSDEPAVLAGHGPIDAGTARRLAGGAKGWERVMTSPINGGVLAVDRYRPGKDLKRFLRARDEHCRFPGCRMPVWRCDIDHTHDAALGGVTRESNLAHLCKGHHTLKHASGWQVRQLGGGILEWRSPSGRTYTDRPEPTVRFTLDPIVAFAPDATPPGRGAPGDDPARAFAQDGDPPPF